ncbi:MAG: phenylalanine--tRNA ligase subunit alpha [Patescibacteria group bacterium]
MDIVKIKNRANEDIRKIKDLKGLEDLRVKYLGRKSELVSFLRSMKDKSITERRKVGPIANNLRKELELLFNNKLKEFKKGDDGRKLDVTRPGIKVERGHSHPLTLLDSEVRRIFASMNFSIVEGPEVESEYYNFDALNIPAGHPARDLWDTFWLKSENRKEKSLLRTHTSPMQIRYMETHEPPFQIIVPGRVFRYEATDASHEFNFYQVEGLMVGPNITLANFKYVIEEFFKKLFGTKIKFRFRPSYFPFVEPGVEVDIKLPGGKWLEVMGAGMVHRKVFDNVRYNPDKVQGFAFGIGLDRLAMIKYNIPDIRLFYSGDLRFIKQF